jgi:hypothetical protein
MSDCEHAAVEPMQAPDPDAIFDRAQAEARREQLLQAYDAVLRLVDSCDAKVGGELDEDPLHANGYASGWRAG